MSEQANIQRIGAYAWTIILTVAGGALIIGALGGAPGDEPATVLAQEDHVPAIGTADADSSPRSKDGGTGIRRVSGMK